MPHFEITICDFKIIFQRGDIMSEELKNYEETKIQSLIITVREQKVILDADLAKLYGVQTKRLNEAVRRNIDRFPEDFVFRLYGKEFEVLRTQIATGSQKHRDPRFLPYAFTEHGAIMAANVLNSPQAVQMSVFVVRAFVRMRSMLADTKELGRRLADLEKELTERLDVHESAIVSILQRVLDILDPPPSPVPPR